MFIWAHQSVMGTPIGPTSSRLALVSTRHKVQKSSRENVMNMDSQVEGRLQNVCQAHEINKKKTWLMHRDISISEFHQFCQTEASSSHLVPTRRGPAVPADD